MENRSWCILKLQGGGWTTVRKTKDFLSDNMSDKLNPLVVNYTCKNELLPIKEVNFVVLIGNEK